MKPDPTDFFSAFRNLPIGIFAVDCNYNVLYWNATMETWTGISREEMVGEDIRSRYENMAEVQLSRRMEAVFEYRLPLVLSAAVHKHIIPAKKPGGGNRLQDTKIVGAADPRDGRQSIAVFAIEDVTETIHRLQGYRGQHAKTVEQLIERQRTEKLLAAERSKLESVVAFRTKELTDSLRQLKETNVRLREADRHKSRFLSSMSHELRTPLNAILGFADLLKGRYFGPLNEKQLDYIRQVEESGQHLLALISDLLDVAKIDAGAMELEFEDIPVSEFIHATTRMMNTQLQKKGLTLKTYVDSELTTVMADRRRWKQIMLNLLSNAIKYTPEGGRIEVKVGTEGRNLLRVEVIDTGIGIEPEEREKIFSEFHQTDRVRDEQLGGTGIGLALTKRMVELHGGQIGVDSQLGEGSTFWFTIPLKRPQGKHEEVKEEKASDTLKVEARTVLVVEDNERNLKMITDMLSIKGFNIVTARDGREAISAAESTMPDIILMDVRMPNLDGYSATRILRSKPGFERLPIIAVTASAGDNAERECLEAGCTAHLPKPITSKELFGAIAKCMKKV